jgi:hypothetical protein
MTFVELFGTDLFMRTIPPGVFPLPDRGRRLPSHIVAGIILHGIPGVATEPSQADFPNFRR